MDPLRLGYLVVFAVTTVVLGWLARWCARNQDANASREFLAVLLITAGWAGTITVQLLFVEYRDVQLLTLYASNVINHLLWMATVLFAFAFTNDRRRLRHPGILLLLAVGVLVEFAILTNPLHHLVLSGFTIRSVPFPHLTYQRGPLFVVAYIAGYAATTVAAGHVLVQALRSTRHVRHQSALILSGIGTASAGNLAYHFGITPVDTTPLGLFGFAIGSAVAIYHYRLLEITPIAYSHVFDEVTNAIIVVDAEGRVAMANAAAEELFETAQRQFVGSSYRDALPEPLCTTLREHDREEHSEIIELDGDAAGTFRVTTSTISTNHDETKVATAIVLEDLTQLVEQQEQLERQKQQLERRNEQLDRFASTVSHDLRNPLTVAQGYTDMIAETGQTDHAEQVADSLDRMEEIIDDVLVLARQGRSVDDPVPVLLDRVVTRAWSSIEAPAASLTIEGSMEVNSDPERLRTLFENLFRNSVEHGRDDVSIRVGPLANEQGFYVSDDGPGIPDEEKPNIFEHGYTTETEGTGFGLSIVEQVVEAHGWEISVTDADPGGARFEVRF